MRASLFSAPTPPLTLSLVTQRLVLEPVGPPRAEPPAGSKARGGGVGRMVCTTREGGPLSLLMPCFFSKPEGKGLVIAEIY